MLKKLKSLFIIEDESDAVAKSQNTAPSAKENAAPSKDNTAAPVKSTRAKLSTSGTGKQKVNEKFLNILLGAMDKNNLQGFDYLEFKQFLQSLSAVGMDEETKYKSAFATAQTMGATLAILQDSAKHYLTLLSEERAKFDAAVEKRRTSVLDQQKQNLNKLKESIKKKQEQIERLNAEIAEGKKKVELKSQEIEQSKEKVEKTNAEFVHAYSLLVGQIENDVNKINMFLS